MTRHVHILGTAAYASDIAWEAIFQVLSSKAYLFFFFSPFQNSYLLCLSYPRSTQRRLGRAIVIRRARVYSTLFLQLITRMRWPWRMATSQTSQPAMVPQPVTRDDLRDNKPRNFLDVIVNPSDPEIEYAFVILDYMGSTDLIRPALWLYTD